MSAALHLEGLRITIAQRVLVDRFDAVVLPGQCLTVMGPSGCGKSSLLSFIAGTLDEAFEGSGQIRIGTEDLTRMPPQRRRLGMLFQDDLLFPHLSVAGNLAFALPASVRPRSARRERIASALAEAGLAGFEDRDPATLSGGQRARVAVLRTLLAAPRALLLDEPFSRLDAALRDGFRRFVFDHARRLGLPTVLVTHDAQDAAAAGGEVRHLGGVEPGAFDNPINPKE